MVHMGPWHAMTSNPWHHSAVHVFPYPKSCSPGIIQTVRRRENSCTRCWYIKTKRSWKILYILCRHCHALHTFLAHVDRSELTVTLSSYPLPYPIENLVCDGLRNMHAAHQISVVVQISHDQLSLFPMGKSTLRTPTPHVHISH